MASVGKLALLTVTVSSLLFIRKMMKDDLAAEACTSALRGLDAWISASEKGGFEAAVRNYLTPEHRDDRAHGCLLAALGSDIVRQPRTVRHAMTEGFRTTIDKLVRLLPGRSAQALIMRRKPSLRGVKFR
jgi:hypothetical protein